MHATSLSFLTLFHIGAKQPCNSFRPKKNMVQYLNSVVGLSGLPPRPAYQDSHGTTVDRHGMPIFSQTTATGLVVSGVDVVSIMSTLLDWISCSATCPARVELDWLSWTTMLTL